MVLELWRRRTDRLTDGHTLTFVHIVNHFLESLKL